MTPLPPLLPLMKPSRWLAYLPLAILPFLAATVIEGPRLSRLLAREVTHQLAAAGHGWAKVAVDGRDVVIRGIAPDRAAATAALARAKATWGVRMAVLRGRATP